MNHSPPYRHVVLFQFKAETSEEAILEIEAAFGALCAELEFVKDFEWGINSSPEPLSHGFSHCFIVTFDDPAGRDAYLPHRYIRRFVKRILIHIWKRCAWSIFTPDREA